MVFLWLFYVPVTTNQPLNRGTAFPFQVLLSGFCCRRARFTLFVRVAALTAASAVSGGVLGYQRKCAQKLYIYICYMCMYRCVIFHLTCLYIYIYIIIYIKLTYIIFLYLYIYTHIYDDIYICTHLQARGLHHSFMTFQCTLMVGSQTRHLPAGYTANISPLRPNTQNLRLFKRQAFPVARPIVY